MYYSYKHDLQGYKPPFLQYLKFAFDRQLSEKAYYFNKQCQPEVGSVAFRIMNSVSKVSGVIRPNLDDILGSGLICVKENLLTVRICSLNISTIPELAKTIVKRVQRIIAPHEPRQLVNSEKTYCIARERNLKTWGST